MGKPSVKFVFFFQILIFFSYFSVFPSSHDDMNEWMNAGPNQKLTASFKKSSTFIAVSSYTALKPLYSIFLLCYMSFFTCLEVLVGMRVKLEEDLFFNEIFSCVCVWGCDLFGNWLLQWVLSLILLSWISDAYACDWDKLLGKCMKVVLLSIRFNHQWMITWQSWKDIGVEKIS